MLTTGFFRKLRKTNFAIISIWTANLEKRRYKNKVERGTFYYNPGWYSIIYISASKWPPSFYRYFSTKRWKFPQTRLVFFGIHLCCYFVHTLLQIIDTIRLSLLNDMVHFPPEPKFQWREVRAAWILHKMLDLFRSRQNSSFSRLALIQNFGIPKWFLRILSDWSDFTSYQPSQASYITC